MRRFLTVMTVLLAGGLRFSAPAALLLVLTVSTAQAQGRREGFWFSTGLGRGWNDPQGVNANGNAAYLRLGGTLNSQVLLGSELIAWARDEAGTTETRANLTFSMLLFPSRSGGLFIKTGVGLTSIGVRPRGKFGSDVQGFGATTGIGFDIRLFGSVHLTPNADLLFQLFDAPGHNLVALNKLAILTVGLTFGG